MKTLRESLMISLNEAMDSRIRHFINGKGYLRFMTDIKYSEIAPDEFDDKHAFVYGKSYMKNINKLVKNFVNDKGFKIIGEIRDGIVDFIIPAGTTLKIIDQIGPDLVQAREDKELDNLYIIFSEHKIAEFAKKDDLAVYKI